MRDERTWKDRDDYALRSMAQTRATSKALRGPLGFIVTLAGFEATPSEEMPADSPAVDRAHSHGPPASEALRGEIGPAILRILGGDESRAREAYKRVTVDLGVNYMPQAAAQALVTVAGSLDEPPWMSTLPDPE